MIGHPFWVSQAAFPVIRYHLFLTILYVSIVAMVSIVSPLMSSARCTSLLLTKPSMTVSSVIFSLIFISMESICPSVKSTIDLKQGEVPESYSSTKAVYSCLVTPHSLLATSFNAFSIYFIWSLIKPVITGAIAASTAIY